MCRGAPLRATIVDHEDETTFRDAYINVETSDTSQSLRSKDISGIQHPGLGWLIGGLAITATGLLLDLSGDENHSAEYTGVPRQLGMVPIGVGAVMAAAGGWRYVRSMVAAGGSVDGRCAKD